MLIVKDTVHEWFRKVHHYLTWRSIDFRCPREHPRTAPGERRKMIERGGQLKMRLDFDENHNAFLLGGFCIPLEFFDVELDIHGVSENGWNGIMVAQIDGNGLMNLIPEVELDEDHFLFKGGITDTDLVPYKKNSNTRKVHPIRGRFERSGLKDYLVELVVPPKNLSVNNGHF